MLKASGRRRTGRGSRPALGGDRWMIINTNEIPLLLRERASGLRGKGHLADEVPLGVIYQSGRCTKSSILDQDRPLHRVTREVA